MKPNQNQKEVIKATAYCILHWEETNDINSPSHWTMNDEFITNNTNVSFELEELLDETGLKQQIADKLNELLTLIRQIK